GHRRGTRCFINEPRELLRLVFSILDLLSKGLLLRRIKRSQLDCQLIEIAGEPEWWLIVVVIYSRAGIHSDIEGLANRCDKWNGVRNRLVGDFFAIHRQDAGAALAETGAVVFEVKHDGVLAGRERLRAFPAETFGSELDVGEDRLALEQIEP